MRIYTATKQSAELKYMIDNLDKKAIELYYKRLWDFSSNKKISNDLLTHLRLW